LPFCPHEEVRELNPVFQIDRSRPGCEPNDPQDFYRSNILNGVLTVL